MEDERVAAFGRLLHDWILNVSEPQIRAREKGTVTDPAVADEGKSRTDEMRGILSDLRRHALDDADERQQAAFDSAAASQRATRTVLLLAIIIALGSGAWIARDIAGTTGAARRGARRHGPPRDDRSPCPRDATSSGPSRAAWRR